MKTQYKILPQRKLTKLISYISNQIYNGMSILLKSLIAVTRATPAYKLSRKQSTDSYNIYYRIYTGEPHTHNLGGYICVIFVLRSAV